MLWLVEVAHQFARHHQQNRRRDANPHSFRPAPLPARRIRQRSAAIRLTAPRGGKQRPGETGKRGAEQ